jgi:hypothetical protein
MIPGKRSVDPLSCKSGFGDGCLDNGSDAIIVTWLRLYDFQFAGNVMLSALQQDSVIIELSKHLADNSPFYSFVTSQC